MIRTGAPKVFANDRDLGEFSVIVEETEGFESAPAYGWRTEETFGDAGAVLLDDAPVINARSLRVHGVLLADTIAELQQRKDALTTWFNADELRLRTRFMPTRQFRARRQRLEFASIRPQMRAVDCRSRVVIECIAPIPYSEDRSALSVGFTTTPGMCPLGTAYTEPEIVIHGPSTNPIITQRTAWGEVVGSMQLTVTLAASNDYVRILCKEKVIYTSINQVVTKATAILIAGHFMRLEPRHAEPAAGLYPTLEVTQGQGEAIYPRRWA